MMMPFITKTNYQENDFMSTSATARKSISDAFIGELQHEVATTRTV
jgi:hypothetical protein